MPGCQCLAPSRSPTSRHRGTEAQAASCPPIPPISNTNSRPYQERFHWLAGRKNLSEAASPSQIQCHLVLIGALHPLQAIPQKSCPHYITLPGTSPASKTLGRASISVATPVVQSALSKRYTSKGFTAVPAASPESKRSPDRSVHFSGMRYSASAHLTPQAVCGILEIVAIATISDCCRRG